MNFLRRVTTKRPLCFLASVLATKDILLGTGFILGIDNLNQGRLYSNFDALWPGMSGDLMGLLFIIVGVFVLGSVLAGRPYFVRLGLRFQAYAWLFSGLMYMLNGFFLVSIIYGFFFSILAGYLAFYFKYSKEWPDRLTHRPLI
jgi:hypothetical protein